jgi:hypothetical protein
MRKAATRERCRISSRAIVRIPAPQPVHPSDLADFRVSGRFGLPLEALRRQKDGKSAQGRAMPRNISDALAELGKCTSRPTSRLMTFSNRALSRHERLRLQVLIAAENTRGKNS